MIARRRLEAGATASGAVAVILFCSGAKVASAAVSFVPSVGAVAAWTDNIDLAPPGQERSGEIEEVEPGFSLTDTSQLETAELDYTLHALFFEGGHHDFLHSGHLLSATRLIPEWFEIDLSALREQGLADPAAPADLSYLFPTSNLANYTTGLVKPTFKHIFSAFQAEASYTRGISDFGQVSAGGSDYRSNIQGADANVSSIEPTAKITWDTTYRLSEVSYEQPYPLRYEYEQGGGDVGVLTIPTLRLIGRGGAESNPGATGLFDGGLAATYWAAGFDRSTGPTDDLKFLVGHRFFGRSYEGSWRKESRLLKLEVNYTEQPNTQEGIAAGESLASSPVVSVPGLYGFTQLGPGVFLNKALNGAATLTGRLTEIGIGVDSDERHFYDVAIPGVLITPRLRMFFPVELQSVEPSSTPYDERYETATLFAKRQLGPLTDFTLSGTYGHTELTGFADGEYKTQRYTALLTRRIGQYSSVHIRADHIHQYGQLAEYTENIVSLGINVSLGKPPESRNGFGTGFGSMYEPIHAQ